MRVLLVEDDRDMASALQVALKAQGMIVDVAVSLAEAEVALRSGHHRLLLLDRQLPDGDGASLVARARQIVPHLPAIMLTAKATIADRVSGLDHGADDYLTKPFAVEELMARIRAISRRPQSEALPVLVLGRLRFDFVSRVALVDEMLLALPRRQLLVLEALALRQGRTVSRDALLEAVYGFDDEIESNALEAHVSKLRRALAEARSGVCIHVMRNLGYILRQADREEG
jgi:DNA-binding response OmpR family regulator